MTDTADDGPAQDVRGRTLRIGLTGPIGCGKSTVAAWLRELGAVVIDADTVAREVSGPGTPGAAAIVAAFGAKLLRADGALDRGALARIVFADPDALVLLESIVHPLVRPAILEAMAAAQRDGAPAVVVEAIKLVEGGLAELCDEVWLVTCDPAVQLERVLARSGAGPLAGADADASARHDTDASARRDADFDRRADAAARIAAQSGLAERLLDQATRVIDTTGDRIASRAIVEDAWSAAIASAPPSDRQPPASS